MKRFYGLVAMGLILGLASGASAHIGDRIYLIFELSEADLADIDLRDADITDWEDVLGDASLVPTDFFQDPTVGEGAQYDPADLDYRIWLGWNGNLGTIWMGMERIDNIYINEYAGGDLGSLWRHDSIEFMLDGDHTGGDYTGSADKTWTDEERVLNNNRTAQQYLAIGGSPDGRHVGYLGRGTEWVNALPLRRWRWWIDRRRADDYNHRVFRYAFRRPDLEQPGRQRTFAAIRWQDHWFRYRGTGL